MLEMEINNTKRRQNGVFKLFNTYHSIFSEEIDLKKFEIILINIMNGLKFQHFNNGKIVAVIMPRIMKIFKSLCSRKIIQGICTNN